MIAHAPKSANKAKTDPHGKLQNGESEMFNSSKGGLTERK